MAAQLMFVFLKAFNCRHNISFFGKAHHSGLYPQWLRQLHVHTAKLSVAGYIRYLQIESDAALLRPFKSPGPREL